MNLQRLYLFLLPITVNAHSAPVFDEQLVPLKQQAVQILTGNFHEPGNKDIVSVGKNQTLSVYRPRNRIWSHDKDWKLEKPTLALGTINTGEKDLLVTIGPGQVSSFDPSQMKTKELFRVDHNLQRNEAIPVVRINRDLNGDGKEDFILPDVSGFFISLQTGPGEFSPPVRLGPPEPFRHRHALDDKRPYGTPGITRQNIGWYLSRVYNIDFNGDGLIDLGFWNENHFTVYLQNPNREFALSPLRQACQVSFDAAGVYSIIFLFEDAGTFRLLTGLRRKTRHTVLHSIQDVTSDGIADLVTFSIEGRSIMRHKSWYEIHPGDMTENGLEFPREPAMTIRSTGGAGAMQGFGYSTQRFRDIDNDGHVDMLLGHVNMGITKILRAMAGNSVTIDIDAYRGEGGALKPSPADSRKIRPAIEPLSKRGPYFPAVMLGDVTGDGRDDLLLGTSWDTLSVYRGTHGKQLFESHATVVSVPMPNDERHARLLDLNRDGRQDLLIRYPKTAPDEMRIMLAR